MNFSLINFKHKFNNRSLMNKVIMLSIAFFSLQFVVYSQILRELEVISPIHEELSAIKKGNAWAFVDKDGSKVIDFRKDLVSSKTDDNWYPKFIEGKCLIRKMVDGENFYGFINKEGKTVIEPQYLNATNFTNGFALIIKLDKSKMGTNTALGKKMVNLKMEEYVIDATGKIVKFLDNSRAYIPSTTANKKTPTFRSKFIAPHLAAVKMNNGKWDIYKF